MKDVTNSYSPFEDLRRQLPADLDSWDPLAKAQWLESTIFMSGYLLSSQGDRMSMANSVEGRYPFLDYRVIEYCNSLPSDFKLKGLNEKYFLKKLLKNKIPESIVKRTKQPYRAPVNNVFLSSGAPEYVREMLSESQTERAGIFSYRSVSMALSRMRRTGITSEMDDMLLTSIISSHLLYNQFVENRNETFRNNVYTDHRIIEDTAAVLS